MDTYISGRPACDGFVLLSPEAPNFGSRPGWKSQRHDPQSTDECASTFEKNPLACQHLIYVFLVSSSGANSSSNDLASLEMNSNLFTKAIRPARALAQSKLGSRPKIQQCLNKGAHLHASAIRIGRREECKRATDSRLPGGKRVCPLYHPATFRWPPC